MNQILQLYSKVRDSSVSRVQFPAIIRCYLVASFHPDRISHCLHSSVVGPVVVSPGFRSINSIPQFANIDCPPGITFSFQGRPRPLWPRCSYTGDPVRQTCDSAILDFASNIFSFLYHQNSDSEQTRFLPRKLLATYSQNWITYIWTPWSWLVQVAHRCYGMNVGGLQFSVLD